MRNISGKGYSKNQNTHFMYNNSKVSKEYADLVHPTIWYPSKTNLYPVTEK
jgi:hypothetical protein